MARAATPAELAPNADELTFADVPANFRPSAWRYWQRRCVRQADESHEAWRMRCDEAHWESYCSWLIENGLVEDGTPIDGPHSMGVAVAGWRWSELAAWEGPQ